MKSDEAYEVRSAVAASTFGHHLAARYPDRAEKLIDDTATGMSLALENAMRVKITPEIKRAAWEASGYGGDIPDHAYDSIIKAAFRAAGFEVVE
jgi:hypothetical protein